MEADISYTGRIQVSLMFSISNTESQNCDKITVFLFFFFIRSFSILFPSFRLYVSAMTYIDLLLIVLSLFVVEFVVFSPFYPT